MKKSVILIAFLLAIAYRGFAQDTITGTVSRIAAPYFEQNACDSRFAIVSEDETYYVMVDNYWPNPYLEDLVVHYDTIAVGNEISVIGNILEMEDGNGETFTVIDIQELINAENDFFYSYISWLGGIYPIAFPGPDPINACAIVDQYDGTLYFVAIDGTLQTSYYTWVVNGTTLNNNIQYLFIGCYETWIDYNGEPFRVFNLKAAIPCNIATNTLEGALVLDDGLHITTPHRGTSYLSLYNGTSHNYLTIKKNLLHDFINPDLYDENFPVSISGIETIHHDIFGKAFLSFEIVKMQTQEDKMLGGILQDAPMPAAGVVPVPGMEMAFYSGNHFYYVDNTTLSYPTYAVVVGYDTIPCCGTELHATFTSTMRINNFFEPYYRIYISDAEITTGTLESVHDELLFSKNPSLGIIEISSDWPMESISAYDLKGQTLFNKSRDSGHYSIDLKGFKGLVLIRVVFKNGQTTSKKVIVR